MIFELGVNASKASKLILVRQTLKLETLINEKVYSVYSHNKPKVLFLYGSSFPQFEQNLISDGKALPQ